MTDKKVLVIGAGMAGPAAAILLKRKGFDVQLIERAPQFKNIGFGISIWPNGYAVLKELGLDKEVEQAGYPVSSVEVANASGHALGKPVPLAGIKRFGAKVMVIERSVIHGLLVKKMTDEGIPIRLGTTIVNLIDDGAKAHVTFSSGEEESFDLVVAADGIRSETRERLFGKHQFHFYGWSVRAFWVPSGIPIPRNPIALCKERATMAIFPLRDKGFALFYEYNPKRLEAADRPMFFEPFLPYLEKHGWHKEHMRQFEAEAIANHGFYDHLRYVHMGKWHKGRVVLLGDARHGFSPIIGMGANMALEAMNYEIAFSY